MPSGSPPVSGYMVSVGERHPVHHEHHGHEAVPAWTNETVSVYAVNSVGNGPSTRERHGLGPRRDHPLPRLAQRRLAPSENDCTTPAAPGPSEGSSGIDWITTPASAWPAPAGTNEYLCTTYYIAQESGTVSGDVYALVTTPTNAACTAALPGYQPPDTPHPIAYVSTSRSTAPVSTSASTRATRQGSSGTFTSYELSPLRQDPVRVVRRLREVQLLDVSQHRLGPLPPGLGAQCRP